MFKSYRFAKVVKSTIHRNRIANKIRVYQKLNLKTSKSREQKICHFHVPVTGTRTNNPRIGRPREVDFHNARASNLE